MPSTRPAPASRALLHLHVELWVLLYVTCECWGRGGVGKGLQRAGEDGHGRSKGFEVEGSPAGIPPEGLHELSGG